ncbi:MAG: hypothetical protein IJN43_16210 [Ruminococcus sp.]|nr:hypothetical protein [Oscillospiraceae bacterium]MBQ6945843.1 hypothetical protein [Ruminococcus sp.]
MYYIKFHYCASPSEIYSGGTYAVQGEKFAAFDSLNPKLYKSAKVAENTAKKLAASCSNTSHDYEIVEFTGVYGANATQHNVLQNKRQSQNTGFAFGTAGQGKGFRAMATMTENKEYHIRIEIAEESEIDDIVSILKQVFNVGKVKTYPRRNGGYHHYLTVASKLESD